MKVVSWNIAGGRTLATKNHWDYKSENLGYFIRNIRELNPDIICIQENHSNKNRSVAEEIAEKLEIPYSSEISSHQSHIDKRYSLGLAVLSKYKVRDSKKIKLPYPRFKLVFSDGREAKHFDKHIQQVVIDKLSIVNTQLQPIGLWRYRHDEGK